MTDDGLAGVQRAAIRLYNHRKQWADTPKSTKVSRQVKRAESRYQLKSSKVVQPQKSQEGY